MSRLRRIALSERYFFVTSNLARGRSLLREPELRDLCSAITKAREMQGFWLIAWVFLPDHWHAILYPPYPLAISSVLRTIKLRSTSAINQRLHETGSLWQGRFFDRILRTVKEYGDTVDYIHMNPVRREIVSRPEEWRWSSIHSYQKTPYEAAFPVNVVNLPSDPDFACGEAHGAHVAQTRVVCGSAAFSGSCKRFCLAFPGARVAAADRQTAPVCATTY